MAEFRYEEPFPTAKDETPWRNVASDLVSTATFEGQEVLKVFATEVQQDLRGWFESARPTRGEEPDRALSREVIIDIQPNKEK